MHNPRIDKGASEFPGRPFVLRDPGQDCGCLQIAADAFFFLCPCRQQIISLVTDGILSAEAVSIPFFSSNGQRCACQLFCFAWRCLQISRQGGLLAPTDGRDRVCMKAKLYLIKLVPTMHAVANAGCNMNSSWWYKTQRREEQEQNQSKK